VDSGSSDAPAGDAELEAALGTRAAEIDLEPDEGEMDGGVVILAVVNGVASDSRRDFRGTDGEPVLAVGGVLGLNGQRRGSAGNRRNVRHDREDVRGAEFVVQACGRVPGGARARDAFVEYVEVEDPHGRYSGMLAG